MFGNVMEKKLENDLLMFFSSLLKEWRLNLTNKKVKVEWNWKKKFHK